MKRYLVAKDDGQVLADHMTLPEALYYATNTALQYGVISRWRKQAGKPAMVPVMVRVLSIG